MKASEVSPQQLALIAVPAPVTPTPAIPAIDAAVWAGICDAAIEQLAATGEEFTAYDLVTRLDVPEPPHPNHWGRRLQIASRRGVIAKVRYCRSHRRTVAGSAVAVWVGVPDTLTPHRKAASSQPGPYSGAAHTKPERTAA